jgi:predicted nucleotidyltransferase
MPARNLVIPLEPIQAFCLRWRVVELSLFGSAVRGDFRADSDVDLLVTLADDAALDLGDWATMIEELRGIFGRDVDLVSRRALRNPFLRHEILSTHEVIFRAA